jgi:mRNA interferase RelE/StbE
MSYEVTLHRRVLKRLRTIHPKHRQQILARLRSLSDISRPQDCTKLKTPLEGYRITIGEYRALYTIDDAARQVSVYLVIQRGEGYPD